MDLSGSESDDDESFYDMSMINDVDTPMGNLLEAMKTLKEDTTPITKDMNYAHVVTFREAMGNTLALITSFRHDSGYSWLVDTALTYQERTSDDEVRLTALPEESTRRNCTSTAMTSRNTKKVPIGPNKSSLPLKPSSHPAYKQTEIDWEDSQSTSPANKHLT